MGYTQSRYLGKIILNERALKTNLMAPRVCVWLDMT